jgi:hypothetical protein
MFGRKPKPQAPPPPQPSIRDTLFGDMPLDAWGPPDATEPPWALFSGARLRLEAGDSAGAAQTLGMVLTMPGLESRHYLQAYHHLRALSESLPEQTNAKELLARRHRSRDGQWPGPPGRVCRRFEPVLQLQRRRRRDGCPDADIKGAIDALFGASRIVVEQIDRGMATARSRRPMGRCG